MDKKHRDASDNDAKLVDLLNRALKIEYSLIIHYPRLANAVEDKEVAKKVMSLSTASVGHASAVASAIASLGGDPQWSFEPFPEGTLSDIFRVQLEKERAALLLHRECAQLALNPALREQLNRLASDEEWHIQVAGEILDYLVASGATG
jgi:bacterioferritin (cytochrome b1)